MENEIGNEIGNESGNEIGNEIGNEANVPKESTTTSPSPPLSLVTETTDTSVSNVPEENIEMQVPVQSEDSRTGNGHRLLSRVSLQNPVPITGQPVTAKINLDLITTANSPTGSSKISTNITPDSQPDESRTMTFEESSTVPIKKDPSTSFCLDMCCLKYGCCGTDTNSDVLRLAQCRIIVTSLVFIICLLTVIATGTFSLVSLYKNAMASKLKE